MFRVFRRNLRKFIPSKFPKIKNQKYLCNQRSIFAFFYNNPFELCYFNHMNGRFGRVMEEPRIVETLSEFEEKLNSRKFILAKFHFDRFANVNSKSFTFCRTRESFFLRKFLPLK